MIRYAMKQKCKEYDKHLIKYTSFYKTVLYIKLTWNPQASQISSSIDRSYAPLYNPLCIIHESFVFFTARSLPDRTTAIDALCKTSLPVNALFVFLRWTGKQASTTRENGIGASAAQSNDRKRNRVLLRILLFCRVFCTLPSSSAFEGEESESTDAAERVRARTCCCCIFVSSVWAEIPPWVVILLFVVVSFRPLLLLFFLDDLLLPSSAFEGEESEGWTEQSEFALELLLMFVVAVVSFRPFFLSASTTSASALPRSLPFLHFEGE